MPSYKFTKSSSGEIMPYIESGKCVVLHYMNGCIHCEMFMPVWKKVCSYYTNKKGYVLITVESSDMTMLPTSMQNVQGFPTLRAYNNKNAVEDFNDTRSYEIVSGFIEKYAKNPTSSSKEKKEKPKEKSKSKSSSTKGVKDKKEKK